jgi:hypothetical protein
MGNLTVAKQIPHKETDIISFKLAAIKAIQGAIMKISAAGYLDNPSAEAGAVFAGICTGDVDNSGGSAGDLEARVFTSGAFLLTTNGTGLSVADVGSKVYASDSATCSPYQASNEVEIGKIVEVVSATSAWVQIKSY